MHDSTIVCVEFSVTKKKNLRKGEREERMEENKDVFTRD